jgi:glycosyltransferase involved in cell wall biosynthesis
MTESPKVSIVIPTFNQIPYLPACIDHCLFQTYENIEIIIVDGGSTDGTKLFLEHFKADMLIASVLPVSHLSEDNEVVRKKELVFPQNRTVKISVFNSDIGATRTYNEGFRQASGEFCTYIVGDDLPHPHMIEELVSAAILHKADFVYSDMNVVNDQGRIVRQMRMPEYSFKRCFADWYHLGVSHLYRTIWHEKVGLMDVNYTAANDYDHYLRFAMAGASFYHLPKVLYSIRHHGEDRKTGQHSEERYLHLIEESKLCARRARAWLESGQIPLELRTATLWEIAH